MASRRKSGGKNGGDEPTNQTESAADSPETVADEVEGAIAETEASLSEATDAMPVDDDASPDVNADSDENDATISENSEVLEASAEAIETGAEVETEPGPDAEQEPEPDAAVQSDTDPESDPYDDVPEPEVIAETESRSFASRVLTWLVIFFVGIGVALWGGPRLAPHLPSWAAPVAAWLTPGSNEVKDEIGSLRAEIEALKTQTGDQIKALEIMSPTDVAEAVETSSSALSAKTSASVEALEKEIATLRDQLKSTDGSEIESRLAKTETTLTGIETELGALRGELTGAVKGDGVEAEKITAEIAAFSAAVKGLKSEVSALAGKTGSLSQRVDEVEAASARREAEAKQETLAAEQREEETRRRAELSDAMKDLTRRVDAGSPYSDELARVVEIGVAQVPEALNASAETGIPSIAILRNGLPDAAHAAIRASISADAGDGVLGRASAFLESQVASRSLEETGGDSTDAILSRIEARMNAGQLDEALAEADTLPDVAKSQMESWLSQLRQRHGAMNSLQDFVASATPVEG